MLTLRLQRTDQPHLPGRQLPHVPVSPAEMVGLERLNPLIILVAHRHHPQAVQPEGAVPPLFQHLPMRNEIRAPRRLLGSPLLDNGP